MSFHNLNEVVEQFTYHMTYRHLSQISAMNLQLYFVYHSFIRLQQLYLPLPNLPLLLLTSNSTTANFPIASRSRLASLAQRASTIHANQGANRQIDT